MDPELEEGELEYDEVDDYVPLKRPETYAMDIPHKRFAEVDTKYSESEEEPSSASDSDSDNRAPKIKKKKFKVKKLPLQQPVNKLKKYDVWSSRAQQDVLVDTLTSCDVSIKDRTRDVESYDFTIARQLYEEVESKQGTKRTRDDRKNFNFKPRKRLPEDEKEFRGKPRALMNLTANNESSDSELAKELAQKLNEERDDLISKVIEAMGKKRTIEIYEETQKVENEGGMPIMNMTRRRTPGGVFLYLVRNDYHITPEQKRHIFDEDRIAYNKVKKDKKRKKVQELKMQNAIERAKLLPDLLTRAEIFSKENSNRKLKESDENNCTNPPPSPETDQHDDAIDLNSQTNSNSLETDRGKLQTYDDDYLDITCEQADMDLF